LRKAGSIESPSPETGMKVVAPLNRLEEVEALSLAGADEFYCGLLSSEWRERFGPLNANRRMRGNLGSIEEVESVVSEAHRRNRQVSLTVNAQHYSEEQAEEVLGLVERLAGVGLDAVIVSHISLIRALGRRGAGCAIHVSSVASCHNSEAARFYQDLGASRIILPRHVTTGEIAEIAEAVPGVEIEVFVLNDGCVFEEGLCHTVHLPARMGGPICLDRYEPEYIRADGQELEEEERRSLEENEKAYRSFLWLTFGCGFSVAENGVPLGPCGLCAVPALARAGVRALKVVGREAATLRKVRSVEMVRAARDRALAGQDVGEWARALRGNAHYCESGYMCYYRMG
jgi:collagenase-like PrtC family protease